MLTRTLLLFLLVGSVAAQQNATGSAAISTTNTAPTPGPSPSPASPYYVGLWGDLPYISKPDPNPAPSNVTAVVNLINSMNSYPLAFSVFDGDIKSGSTKCTSDKYDNAIMMFQMQKAPVVYSVGDNEWTDCHRTNNGGYNPLERLSYVRKRFFPNPNVTALGQASLALESSKSFNGTAYPEIARWTKGPAMFVSLHFVGSNNNRVNPGQCIANTTARNESDCAADNIESSNRNAANIAFLNESFDIAREQGLKGVMIIAQAEPNFDVGVTSVNEAIRTPNNDGFVDLLNTLYLQAKSFPGQVMYVHGDSHEFVHDTPLPKTTTLFNVTNTDSFGISGGATLANFARVETFGDAIFNWVLCTVDASHPSLFLVEQITPNP